MAEFITYSLSRTCFIWLVVMYSFQGRLGGGLAGLKFQDWEESQLGVFLVGVRSDFQL